MRSLVQECARAALLLWLASLAAFAVIHGMPADPAEIFLVQMNRPVTPEAVARLHAEWGLDAPLFVQYVDWAGRFVIGDWGLSFRTAQPVLDEFLRRLPVSFLIGTGGLALAALLAIPLGHHAALRPHGIADRASRALAILAQAVPAFWSGLILLWILAVELRWLRPFTGGSAHQLILPTLLIALYSVGTLARVYRTELQLYQAQPYYRTALATGLTPREALHRHGRRHALFGLVAALTPEFGWVVGGTAVTEVVFGIPGVSQFLVDSIAVRDYWVLQGYIMAMAAWMILVHGASVGLRRALDPRICPEA